LRKEFDEVGSGIGFVLPILASLVEAKEFVIVEQPELHLHPQAQSELMTAISRCGQQIAIETHSERFLFELSAMLRRQARTTESTGENVTPLKRSVITSEDISINYIDSALGAGESEVYATRISLSKEGWLIDDWPRGFNWMGVSPAFQQIGTFQQDSEIRRELMALPWLASQTNDLLNWTIDAYVAFTRRDWCAAVIYTGKVMEELLRVQLVLPLQVSLMNSGVIRTLAVTKNDDIAVQALVASLLGRSKKPMTLGNWNHILDAVYDSQCNAHRIIGIVREFIENVAWVDAWRENRELFRSDLKSFSDRRNRAAHPGKIQESDARRYLGLLINLDCGNCAGLAFRALGLEGLPVAGPDGPAMLREVPPPIKSQ
jgi:hypothetical protein